MDLIELVKRIFHDISFWKLLHKDEVAETILFRPSASSRNLCHSGKIYLVRDVSEHLGTPQGLNLFNR